MDMANSYSQGEYIYRPWSYEYFDPDEDFFARMPELLKPKSDANRTAVWPREIGASVPPSIPSNISISASVIGACTITEEKQRIPQGTT